MFVFPKDQELTTAIISKIIEKNNFEIARYRKLEDYYLGKHQILGKTVSDESKPNNKIVNPYPQYITDVLTGYFVGEPITYTSLDEEALDSIHMIFEYNDTATEDTNIAREMSIYGKAYELHYIDEEGNERFKFINPKDMIIVYDDSIEHDILYAIRMIPCYDFIKDLHYMKVEVYDNETTTVFKASSQGTNLEIIDNYQHFYGDVPVVEFKNNEDEIGDFESVLSLVDAYDRLESDSLDDFDYFVDSYLMLTGVNADADDIASMKENRVLLLDTDSSAEWLTKNSTETNVENIKDRINQDIHKFAKVPDLSDENFSANASGVAIKFKLYGTETIISNKERYFQKGLQRRIELIFNVLGLKGSSFDWRAIEPQFTRNIPSNETEIADVVNKLSGIVSTETLLAQVPFVTDVQDELDRLVEERAQNPFYNLSVEQETIEEEE